MIKNKLLNLDRFLFKKKGFTLVEAMITALIGVMSLTAIGVMMTDSGSYTGKDNRYRAYAANVMMKEAEDLRTLSYTTFTGYTSPFYFSDSTSYSATSVSISKLSSGVGTVTVSSPLSSSDIKRADVKVTWNDSKGASKSMSITTYLTKTGINGA